MYALTITTNTGADGKYFNNWLNNNTTFNGITYDADVTTIYFETEPVQSVKDTIINQYNSLTVSQVLQSEIIKEKYEIFKKDGEDYFNNIRTNLVIDFENNVLNEADIYEIEKKLDPVISKILRGDWMTSKNEMDGLIVGGALSQTLYDEIYNYIINYITTNY